MKTNTEHGAMILVFFELMGHFCLLFCDAMFSWTVYMFCFYAYHGC